MRVTHIDGDGPWVAGGADRRVLSCRKAACAIRGQTPCTLYVACFGCCVGVHGCVCVCVCACVCACMCLGSSGSTWMYTLLENLTSTLGGSVYNETGPHANAILHLRCSTLSVCCAAAFARVAQRAQFSVLCTLLSPLRPFETTTVGIPPPLGQARKSSTAGGRPKTACSCCSGHSQRMGWTAPGPPGGWCMQRAVQQSPHSPAAAPPPVCGGLAA